MKVQFDNIPKEVRGKPLFCFAKMELKSGKDKPDKIPYAVYHRNYKDGCRNKETSHHRGCGTDVSGYH